MLNLTGNAGDLFGKNISVFRGPDSFVLICGEVVRTIRTKEDPEKWVNSPYYCLYGETLAFKKIKPYVLPEWDFEGLDSTFVGQQLFDTAGLEKFLFFFGPSYLELGLLLKTCNSATEYWNTTIITNTRLKMAICNYILEHETEQIPQFKNKPFAHLVVKTPPVSCTNTSLPHLCDKIITYSPPKDLFGDYYKTFKKHINHGIYYKVTTGRNECHILRLFTSTTLELGVSFAFNPCVSRPRGLPLVYEGKKIYLKMPTPVLILGAPWRFDKPNFLLNGLPCHLEVLRARGGKYFKKHFSVNNLTVLDLSVKNYLQFVYLRTAPGSRKELKVADYFDCEDYKNYIRNWLIDNDIFHYY